MDFFPIPEIPDDFEIDPAHVLEAASETATSFYGRYVQGVKAIVDSYNIPVGLTPRKQIWQLNKARLYYYEATTPRPGATPSPCSLYTPSSTNPSSSTSSQDAASSNTC